MEYRFTCYDCKIESVSDKPIKVVTDESRKLISELDKEKRKAERDRKEGAEMARMMCEKRGLFDRGPDPTFTGYPPFVDDIPFRYIVCPNCGKKNWL